MTVKHKITLFIDSMMSVDGFSVVALFNVDYIVGVFHCGKKPFEGNDSDKMQQLDPVL
jgi:hypothetical protein